MADYQTAHAPASGDTRLTCLSPMHAEYAAEYAREHGAAGVDVDVDGCDVVIRPQLDTWPAVQLVEQFQREGWMHDDDAYEAFTVIDGGEPDW